MWMRLNYWSFKIFSSRVLKMAVGSCLAIWLAEQFDLEFATSAGIIALLTVVSTKWATVRLSVVRFLSFALTIALAYVLFPIIPGDWIAYGFFLLFLIGISYFLRWNDTVSVNAVIGTHLLAAKTIGLEVVLNELFLLVIGTATALILNLFHDYKNQKNQLYVDMKYAEQQLQFILKKTADYLHCKELEGNVWEDLRVLEGYLSGAVERAYEYQDNTFHSHPDYYINYLEMRTRQCDTLHDLHYELKKIRQFPEQAGIVADYILYMQKYVTEHNLPERQMDKLQHLFEHMKEEPLPANKEDYESHVILYHILMDLEDFLIYKKRFIEALDDKQREIYWKDESKD